MKLFSKNFILLVLGQVSSLFANFILKFALSMYVLDITGSASIFASMLAIATLPTILLSPLGGILADRANRRNIMVGLDSLTGLSIFLAMLFLSESTNILVIGILLILLSIFGAFESPTVQACVPLMQSGENLIKGNAVVNQVAAIAALIAPLLGSALYVSFGLIPIMVTSMLCCFITALFESFIKLPYQRSHTNKGILTMIKIDFTLSMDFICKTERSILKMLLLAAMVNFFLMGCCMVGLPYLIRSILELDVGYYGIAESVLGITAILGSLLAGCLTSHLKLRSLSLILFALGFFLLPTGISFLLPLNSLTRYVIILIGFSGMQIAACIFFIFALSFIQQKTPNHFIGKVMAHITTITLCAQPLGQMIYGLLFERLSQQVYFVLIPTSLLIYLIALIFCKFFKKLELLPTN